MSHPTTNVPPFALDGTVTLVKLQELLGVEAELTWLDYKSECDLSDTAAMVELVKDVGAMMIAGGYLVVGADDRGSAIGLTSEHAKLFDQASLSQKLAKYVPTGFEVRSAVHDVRPSDGSNPVRVAIIWVAPHPDGWAIFTRNGDYTVNGKTKTAFRVGEVYARHGTRSEPWDQTDIATARAQLVARAKDLWRAEIRAELHDGQTAAATQNAVASGPSAAFTWQLDTAGFEAAVVELIRRDDDIPVRRMLRIAEANARQLRDDGNIADLQTVLDRITTVASLGVDLERRLYLDLGLNTLLAIYDQAVAAQYAPTTSSTPTQLPAPVLWLRVAERLYVLGALAVRKSDWTTVRTLALAPLPALRQQGSRRTWHRHALTEASRSGLMQKTTADGGRRRLSVLLFARSVAAANPSLRPDLPGEVDRVITGPDPLLTSLCQFDILALIISGVETGATTKTEVGSVAYPNYARFDGGRTTDVVLPLITATDARRRLLNEASDASIAAVLRAADEIATREGFGFVGWDGYANDAITSFIQLHTRSS